MIQKEIPKESFAEYFFLNFTKELLRNTETYNRVFLEKEVKVVLEKESKKHLSLEKGDVKGFVKRKLKEEERKISQLQKGEGGPRKGFIPSMAKPVPKRTSPFQMPQFRLPETVSHYRPVPLAIDIDLDKLNPLVRDPAVNVIECSGPDKKVHVLGAMGKKPTGIVLTKEEIDSVIERFSQETRIPIHEGVFKMVFGKLILTAIVSEVVGSKFIITKMRALPPPGPQATFPTRGRYY